MDLSDAADGQHFTCGFAGELVGAVAGTDGDSKSITLGFGDEVSSLCRIGEEHVFGQLTLETVAVFSFTLTGQGAQTTQLTFNTTPTE